MLTQAQIDEYAQKAIGISQEDWDKLVKEIAGLDTDVFANLEAVLTRRDELNNVSVPKTDLFICERSQTRRQTKMVYGKRLVKCHLCGHWVGSDYDHSCVI